MLLLDSGVWRDWIAGEFGCVRAWRDVGVVGHLRCGGAVDIFVLVILAFSTAEAED